jgi:hypothetical protein
MRTNDEISDGTTGTRQNILAGSPNLTAPMAGNSPHAPTRPSGLVLS